MDELLKKGAEQAEGILTEAYKDLLSPTLQPIGQILSYLPRAIRVVGFSKVEKWIIAGEESLKRASEIINDKLKDIPEDQLTDTEPHIVIPAIQQLTYCQDNEVLRNLYANLIASSMIIDKKPLVHPAFIDIVKQLTPDEAKFLSKIPIVENYKAYPLARVWGNLGNKGHILCSHFTDIAVNELDYIREMPTYLENLDRLKIINLTETDIQVREDSKKLRINTEKIFENTAITENYDDISVSVVRSFILTNFGVNFIKTCCNLI